MGWECATTPDITLGPLATSLVDTTSEYGLHHPGAFPIHSWGGQGVTKILWDLGVQGRGLDMGNTSLHLSHFQINLSSPKPRHLLYLLLWPRSISLNVWVHLPRPKPIQNHSLGDVCTLQESIFGWFWMPTSHALRLYRKWVAFAYAIHHQKHVQTNNNQEPPSWSWRLHKLWHIRHTHIYIYIVCFADVLHMHYTSHCLFLDVPGLRSWFPFAGSSARCHFALKCCIRALEFYDDFFGLPYPLPKLDRFGGWHRGTCCVALGVVVWVSVGIASQELVYQRVSALGMTGLLFFEPFGSFIGANLRRGWTLLSSISLAFHWFFLTTAISE